MHILFVDDVDDTRHLFSMAFVLAGHRTASASNGAEALELFSKHRFDAVVLDPVILFSAHHDPDREKRAEQAGAYTLLRKPMLPEHLIAVTENAIREQLGEQS